MEFVNSSFVIIVFASLVMEGHTTLITCTTDVKSDKSGHVHCHFSENIRATRRNFNIIYYPFGKNYSADYAKSNQVLLCNWMSESDNVQCSTKEGFTYQKDVGNATTLNINRVSEEHFGYYICQLVPDMSDDVQMCNLTNSLVIMSFSESSLPTTDSSVVGIVVGVVLTSVVILVIIVIFIRLRRRRFKNKDKNDASENHEEESMPLSNPENGLQSDPEQEEHVTGGEPNNCVQQEDNVPLVNSHDEINKPDINPDISSYSNSESKDNAPEVNPGNEAREPQINTDTVDAVEESFSDKPSDQQPDTLSPASATQQNSYDKDSDSKQVHIVSYHPLFEPQHVWYMDTSALCDYLKCENVKEKIIKQFVKKNVNGTNFESFDYKEKVLKKKKVEESDLEYADQVLKKLQEIRDRQQQRDT